MFQKNKLTFLLPLFLVIIAFFLRFPVMQARQFALAGDESVFGIMVMDVLKGHFPIFYYGQSYMGTLEVYVAALFSLMGGVNSFTIQLASFFFYALFLITNFYLLKKIFGTRVSLFSSFFLLFTSIMFWELNVRVLGAYSSILFLSALSLLFWVKVFKEDQKGFIFPLGLSIGIALWLNGLFMMFLIPLAFLTLFWRRGFEERANFLNPVRLLMLKDFKIPLMLKIPFFFLNLFIVAFLIKHFLVFLTGGWKMKMLFFDFSSPPFQIVRMQKLFFLIGGEAVLLSLFQGGIKPLLGLLKKWYALLVGIVIGYLPALYYSLAGFEGYRILRKSRSIYWNEFLEKLNLIFIHLFPDSVWGVRLDLVQPSGLVVVIILLFFILAYIIYFLSHKKDFVNIFLLRTGIRSVSFFFCLLTLGSSLILLASSLTADRYFMLLCWANAVIAGWFLNQIFIRSKFVSFLLLVLFAGFYSLAAQKYVASMPRGNVIGLVQFLEKENLLGGRADYDTAYRISFYSGQRLKFIPTDGVMRTPHYETFINGLKRRAVVWDRKNALSPAAQEAISGKNMKQIKEFGSYQIYIIDKSEPIPLR